MAPVLFLRVAHEGGGGVVELDDVLAPVLAYHQLQRADLQPAEDLAHLQRANTLVKSKQRTRIKL